jgi:predicted PurR-regulated permease PerM
MMNIFTSNDSSNPLMGKFKVSEGWIVLLIIILIIGGLASSVSPTAESTLNSFCRAIAAGAYQTAYNQLSTNIQHQETEEQFAGEMQQENISRCSVSNVQEHSTNATGTLTYVFANGHVANQLLHLIKQNRTWKIADKAE